MQNSGNPVLDSTVNIVVAMIPAIPTGNVVEKLQEIHATVLKLAEKEPGGICAPAWKQS